MSSEPARPDADDIARRLCADHAPVAGSLVLQVRGCRVVLRSNSAELLERLSAYFAHVLATRDAAADPAAGPDIEVIAIERAVVDTGLGFTDWKREPGKRGRKDAVCDLDRGRVVLKIRTGMLFLQHPRTCIAAGPCLAHDNQVINFINSQFLDYLQRNGYLLCHAAAVCRADNGLAIAGLSGGGKSTLMLRLLDDSEISFVSNDRLAVRRAVAAVGADAVGIPKLPRVNPGTIVHNPRLHPLIDAGMREHYLAMKPDDLWSLECKHDVDINFLYGPCRIRHETVVRSFLVLNWSRNSDTPFRVRQVALERSPALLKAIIKPSGPFYSTTGGRFNRDDTQPGSAPYIEILRGVSIFEACGSIDFEQLESFCLNEILC